MLSDEKPLRSAFFLDFRLNPIYTQLMELHLRKQLVELMLKQGDSRVQFPKEHELDELNAMKKLAFRCFGDRGLLEAGPDLPGVVWIGFYVSRSEDHLPFHRRRRKLVMGGATIAELTAQAKLLGLI